MYKNYSVFAREPTISVKSDQDCCDHLLFYLIKLCRILSSVCCLSGLSIHMNTVSARDLHNNLGQAKHVQQVREVNFSLSDTNYCLNF